MSNKVETAELREKAMYQFGDYSDLVVRLEDAEAAIEAAERRGTEREREACAQVVDRIVGPDDQFAAGFLAEAIRARSRTEGGAQAHGLLHGHQSSGIPAQGLNVEIRREADNAEQIAQEFNRRAWKGKTGNVGGWFVGHNSIQAIRGTGGEGFFTYDFDDARALVAGWQAMEELATLKEQKKRNGKFYTLLQIEKHKEQHRIEQDNNALRAQLAALTAENERLSGKLTDAADTIRILHREKREDADVSEAEAIRLSTKIERLREPAEGVEALAQRIAERLGGDESAIRIKALGGCHCRYNYVNAAALIATELRKGVEPAEGTWQAMETAPKDGTSLLIAVENIVGEARFQGDGANEGWWWAGEDPGDYYADKIDVSPTGWMPLPNPPTANEGSES